MDDECTDHYEKQLYTVFKTFDVNNEEALDKFSVVQLCDALQLEARGAALAAELFAGQPARVSFAQFRAALLAALAAPPGSDASCASLDDSLPAPDSPDAPSAGGESAPDDASDEVSPRLVLGCKRYGRRSRPSRALSAPRAPPAARSPPAPRSASVVPSTELDPARRLDADAALELCRRLRVRGVDRALVARVLRDAAPAPAHATVGEFFDRLNAALTTTIEHAEAGAPPPAAREPSVDDGEPDAPPAAAVLDAWERAGVPRPRRLLAELGFGGVDDIPAVELERALDDERRALEAEGGDEGGRAALLGALALARLRQERAATAAANARAERDTLRGAVAAGERRAALLAAEVDEQHARLEAELRAAGRRQEARRAEDARAAAGQLAAERERAQAALQAAAARHADTERRLREELRALQERAEEAEATAAAAEERAAGLERALAAARSAPPPAPPAGELQASRAAAAEAALAALRAQHATLRDRCDELTAALERRGAEGGAASGAPSATSLWDEAAAAMRNLHDQEVSGSSMESVAVPSTAPAAPSPAPSVDPAPVDPAPVDPAPVDSAPAPAPVTSELQTEVAELERQLLESLEREEQLSELVDKERQEHEQEVTSLNETIERLEASTEALRAECERADRYWAEQLASGANRPGSPSGTSGPTGASASRALCVVPETPQLEEQVTSLQRELELCREEASAEAGRALAAAAAAAAAARALGGQRAAAARLSRDNLRLQHELRAARARPQTHICCQRVPGDTSGRRPCMESCGVGAGIGGGGLLAARLVRAGEAAARLATRLAHADRLVAELFAENCRLQAARVLPDL